MGKEKVVFGIYNADGSFLGELQYAISKVVGKSSCSLCELTHGWNPFGKRKWKTVCKSSDLNIQLIHSCLLYTSPSPRDATLSRMPSSA